MNQLGTFIADERALLLENGYEVVETWTGNETYSNGEWCITARMNRQGFWLHRYDGEGPFKMLSSVSEHFPRPAAPFCGQTEEEFCPEPRKELGELRKAMNVLAESYAEIDKGHQKILKWMHTGK